jgi:hypothetical protein
MSRALYSMVIEVKGYEPQAQQAILDAVELAWDLDDWRIVGDLWMELFGDYYLESGETERDAVKRIVAAIWTANGGKCDVTVQATCLETAPYTQYEYGEAEFTKWKEGETCA